MWHVSSHSGVATLRTAIHLLLTYLPSLATPYGHVPCRAYLRSVAGGDNGIAYIYITHTRANSSDILTMTASFISCRERDIGKTYGFQHVHRLGSIHTSASEGTTLCRYTNLFIIIIIIIFFFDPGTQFPRKEKITLCNTKKYYYYLTPVLSSRGMKKLRYAIQKSTKIKLE